MFVYVCGTYTYKYVGICRRCTANVHICKPYTCALFLLLINNERPIQQTHDCPLPNFNWEEGR